MIVTNETAAINPRLPRTDLSTLYANVDEDEAEEEALYADVNDDEVNEEARHHVEGVALEVKVYFLFIPKLQLDLFCVSVLV